MTRFRPCIDLHQGQVKQIVGGTLDSETDELKTNFVSQHSPAYYSQLYRDNELEGGHVIMLGPGNEDAAREALEAWPGGLQIGGGVISTNAQKWIDAGAEKVIVTSHLFPEGKFSLPRLQSIVTNIKEGPKKLVIDLSCRRVDGGWFVATDKWQTLTDFEITEETIRTLEPYCSEFLIHAADNEGLQGGIDEELVVRLGRWCKIPVTYAGGARNLDDLDLVQRLSNGKVDLTIGSALDCFGGTGAKLDDCVRWNKEKRVIFEMQDS